jgi:type II secretory ATPase GspE/PulE/Tfp pilus assembly ATPase PilB-like protein
MSDLSLPPLSALPFEAAGFAWPTPELPGYPAPAPSPKPLACTLEGVNGHAVAGWLNEFDPVRGTLQLRMNAPRQPLPLKLDQFRRLQLAEPLRPEDSRFDGSDLPPVPFVVQLRNAPAWKGQTLGCQEEAYGLFLFEPLDDAGTVRRWFVPRAAYVVAQIGIPLGEALVQQHSATPEQIQQMLSEQEGLRERRLGDMLVVRQIITAGELAAAIERQAKMPMVRIGQALTALGYISEAQLEDALAQQRADRTVPLGELLVKRGMVSRADLQTALARKMGYPLVDVLQFPADAEAVSRLPYAVASRIPALPLMQRAGRLVVAVEDPSNRARMDEIEFAAQSKIVPVLARAGILAAAVDKAYEKVGAADFLLLRPGTESGPAPEAGADNAHGLLATMERVDAHMHEPEDSPLAQSDNTLVRLINSMILEAHKQGVSDIHIECPAGREKVRIRFRRDGLLRPYLELPPNFRSALIARLKIMCELDISERRKPQDGKINFAKFMQGVKLELRLATIPTQNNLEDAVLRLLVSTQPLPLESLGLSPPNLERVKATVTRPYGMLLCVGPTGSGKTTTLHSLLAHINTPERKVWTAEDPVEITQPGLRQVQVNPRIDWTFAKALRAFLRADPDVIMVGEIRDAETAQVAIEASLTGHLMLSTLHTNSAPETVTRLLDMGMDPFNFADALLGVLAQRLVRRLCGHCRSSRDATPEEEDEWLQDWLHPMQALAEPQPAADVLTGWRERFGQGGRLQHYHAAGCEHCGGSGLRGRAAIHELMMVSRELRHMIQTGQRADALQQQALGEGLRTLRQDGIEKVLAGVTTIEEVRAHS